MAARLRQPGPPQQHQRPEGARVLAEPRGDLESVKLRFGMSPGSGDTQFELRAENNRISLLTIDLNPMLSRSSVPWEHVFRVFCNVWIAMLVIPLKRHLYKIE